MSALWRVTANWKSSNAAIATVDRFGNVTGVKAGSAAITAETDGVKTTRTFAVAANLVSKLEITIKEDEIRTGDVIHLTANAKTSAGATVGDAPVTWAYSYVPDDSIAPNGLPGGAGIVQFGRFTGNYPGRYTLMASAGGVGLGRRVRAASALTILTADVTMAAWPSGASSARTRKRFTGASACGAG